MGHIGQEPGEKGEVESLTFRDVIAIR